MVLNAFSFWAFRHFSQGILLQNLVKCRTVLKKAENEALQCGEKGVDLSRRIIQNLNVQEALGDIHSTVHFVDEIRCTADLLIQLSDKLCKIFGKPLINNQTLNALSKNSIITLIISIFLESAVENHKKNGRWEYLTGEMWMRRNGYFTQLLTEIAECETLEYKRRKEIEKKKRNCEQTQ